MGLIQALCFVFLLEVDSNFILCSYLHVQDLVLEEGGTFISVCQGLMTGDS